MENEKIKNKNIFIDIDALFDLRLPLLYTLLKGGSDDFFKVMKTYDKRYIDEFRPIPKDVFEAYYRNLNKSIFKLAAPTPMFDFVIQLAIELKNSLINNGEEYNIDLYVNVYPFKFNANEIIHLTNAINNVIKLDFVKVKMVSMDNSQIEPKWLKDRIYALIKYNGLEWAEHQIATYKLIEQPLLDMLLVVPALLKGNGEIKKLEDKEINIVFADLTKAFSTLLTLNVVKIEYFCTHFE